MKKKDVFLSYSSKDIQLAKQISELFNKHGYSVYDAPKDIIVGHSYRDDIFEMIRLSDIFVPIVTSNSATSTWCLKEMTYAFEMAEDRSKIIFPISFLKFDSILYPFELLMYKGIYVPTPSKTNEIVSQAIIRWNRHKNIDDLYKQLSAYRQAELPNKEADILIRLIENFCYDYNNIAKTDYFDYIRLCQCLHQMDNLYWPACTYSTKKDLHETLELVWNTFIKDNPSKWEDALDCSFCIKTIYYTWNIRKWLGVSKTEVEYIHLQNQYLKLLIDNLCSWKLAPEYYPLEENYTKIPEKIKFWSDIPFYLIQLVGSDNKNVDITDYLLSNGILHSGQKGEGNVDCQVKLTHFFVEF